MKDRFGLQLSTSSAVAGEQYGEFVDRFIGCQQGARAAIDAAIEADGGFALARVADGFLRLNSGDPDGAKRAALEATDLAATATARERSQIAAIAARINGDGARSAKIFEQHLGEYPRDVLSLFMAQASLGFTGRRTWKQEVGALTDSVVDHYDPDEWSILAIRAFRAEEDRNIGEARELSQRSLDRRPSNARAAHVLAHTYFERAEHEVGDEFLRTWLSIHDPATEFGGHLWWHLALHQLGQDKSERAVQTLRDGIASGGANPFALADRASLLWRLDLYGLTSSGDDWQAVSDLAAALAGAPTFGFVDAHVLLAHAGAQRDDRFEPFVDQLRGQAADGNELAEEVLLPLAAGIGEFAKGRFSESADALEGIVRSGEVVRVGGSNAQREVFEETYIASLLAAGRPFAAQPLIEARLARRHSRVDDRWLSMVASRSM